MGIVREMCEMVDDVVVLVLVFDSAAMMVQGKGTANKVSDPWQGREFATTPGNRKDFDAVISIVSYPISQLLLTKETSQFNLTTHVDILHDHYRLAYVLCLHPPTVFKSRSSGLLLVIPLSPWRTNTVVFVGRELQASTRNSQPISACRRTPQHALYCTVHCRKQAQAKRST